MKYAFACEPCRGRGQVMGDECRTCKGMGLVIVPGFIGRKVERLADIEAQDQSERAFSFFDKYRIFRQHAAALAQVRFEPISAMKWGG